MADIKRAVVEKMIADLKRKLDAHKWKELISLLPLALLCTFWLYKSADFPVHDYANSYFPGRLAVEQISPEDVVFDIYDYNTYIWEKGYPDEFADFYLNSPFTSTFFNPFALVEDAMLSKLIFNLLSILLFLGALWALMRKYPMDSALIGLTLPLIFFVPIRNQILFGQSYMLVFAGVILAFLAFGKGRSWLGGGVLSLVALIKIFPAIYAVALVFKKQWRPLATMAVAGVVLLLLSLLVSGSSFWLQYVTEVMPNAFANESTIDFRLNSFSIDAFFRTLFVLDEYYNPHAIADLPWLYKLLSGLLKSVVLGFTLLGSFKYKDDIFKVLAIWVTALFLIQTRTGSYAQLLWIVPGVVLFLSNASFRSRALFGVLLAVVCNFPILIDAPLLLRFTKLWATIFVVVLIWKELELTFSLKYVALGLIILMPLSLKGIISSSKEDASAYVLASKEYSMIYDFGTENDRLFYRALGKTGDVKVITEVSVSSFDSEACSIKKGQVFLGERQLTFDPALKKKAVLINNCEVYFLTDRMSRRGMFTLKKISVCK